MRRYLYILSIAWLCQLAACTNNQPATPTQATSNSSEAAQQPQPSNIPDFSADSALAYVQKQVDFGPRVPGTPKHKACADWLANQLRRHTDTLIVQSDKVTAYNGKTLPMYNIIGSFNPQATNRVLLCAHWDTRPFADQDDERSTEPILGANDGASGVGILLEIARQLNLQSPNLGVDIVLFDVEDYGKSEVEDSYCLGSQYWAKKPHTPNYKAQYGILLDMVGAGDAVFPKEQFSLAFAPDIVHKVWHTAAELGFDSYFASSIGGTITDDHFYVNKLAHIPTIDIIHYTPEGTFGKYWHTHDDNMSAVNKNTLDAVGTVLLTVIYRDGTPM
jgi:glutaminyl-peptide cyclotransferase